MIENILLNIRTFEPSTNAKINVQCSDKEKMKFVELLSRFQNVFAWSYEDLHGFDPGLIQHTMKLARQEQGLVNSALKETCQGELGNVLRSRIIFSIPLNTRIIPQQVVELQLKPLLDEILGYNKIKVKGKNVHKTTFITNCDTMSTNAFFLAYLMQVPLL